MEAEKELHAIVSVETVVTHEGYVVIIYCNSLIIHTLEANYQAIIQGEEQSIRSVLTLSEAPAPDFMFHLSILYPDLF